MITKFHDFFLICSGTVLNSGCLWGICASLSSNRKISSTTNPYAMKELKKIQTNNGPGVGIIVMDFPSPDQIRNVIKFNRFIGKM